MPHRLQHLTACFIENGQQGLEIIQVNGTSNQILLNKFFDLIIPSMRKGCDGKEEKENGKEKNCENSGPITSTAGTATVRAKMEETGAE